MAAAESQTASVAEQGAQTRVRNYIDSVFAALLDELMLSDGGKPALTLKKRSQSATGYFINSASGALETTASETSVTLSWPGKDVHEAWRFTVAVRVLGVIAEAVQMKQRISKRDIYYSDPASFGSQRVVDDLVDEIAHTIGVDREALNVEPAAKGLTAGCFWLRTTAGSFVNPWLSLENTLIPKTDEIESIEITGISWILIVEKEAIFHRLASNDYHATSAAGKGILITGKGYPDLCTRAFLRKISEAPPGDGNLPPRLLALVDSDPDGMAIMATYKYGSMKHCRDNSRLNVPRLQWLGLRTSEIGAGHSPGRGDALIPLSARDRAKATAMLKNNPVWAEDGPEPDGRAELQQMLMLNLKAETEILHEQEGGLEEWLDRKILNSLMARFP